MAWSFRRRIKIIPGVHLNLSSSGISTSIGVKGASITFGKSGTYLNTGIPELGLYNRRKLSNPENNPLPQVHNKDLPTEFLDSNIFSADIHEITSQNMQGVKEAILLAQEQRKDLKGDLLRIQAALGGSKLKLILSYVLLYGLIKKNIPKSLKIDIDAQKEAIKQTELQIDNCFVKLDIKFESEIQKKYNKMAETFRNLTTSHKIWDVTSAHFQDRIAYRSSASTIVNKREVNFIFKTLPDIRSDFEALYLQNANGADLYVYPNFIVMFSNKAEFAIIGFNEINLNHSYVRFTETGRVPKDSKIIDRTWAKVNKNGTPDRRFKDNYQIPVVKYGEITLSTATGINEEYEFSNYEFTEEFSNAFKEYQKTINRLKQL